jgi:hypothetical protein
MDIYLTSNIIKLKCVDDHSIASHSGKYNFNVNIGETYTANTTTHNGYYFIHETQTVLPSELFITLDKWREVILNDLGI